MRAGLLCAGIFLVATVFTGTHFVAAQTLSPAQLSAILSQGAGGIGNSLIQCPDGGRPAVAADIELFSNVIPGLTVGQCFQPKSEYTGESIAEAKKSLNALWCGGKARSCNSGGSTYVDSMEKLDPKFSICADKFIKQLRETDPGACIGSAWRSVANQICTCGGPLGTPGKCAPAGQSYHQRGLAIDVRSSVDRQQLWKVAAQSGLANPAGLHISDPNHIQPFRGGYDCSAIGYVPSDTDVFTPSPSPVSSLLQQQSPFAQQPPPMSPPPPSFSPIQPVARTNLNTTTYAPGSCTAQNYCYLGSVYSRSNTCVDQLYQTCANGCIGSTCVGSSTSDTLLAGVQPSSSDSSNTSSNSNTNANDTSSGPISDLLTSITDAIGLTPVDIGTPVSIALNPDTNDASNLTPSAASPKGTLMPLTVQPTHPPQTFVSGDLVHAPISTYVARQSSYVLSMLDGLRRALQEALRYINPFGLLMPSQ
jgi:hypothetical protein